MMMMSSYIIVSGSNQETEITLVKQKEMNKESC